jgi:hypothetical protein
MASLDPIPQARVVRNAGRVVAPPPAPRRPPGPVAEQLRIALEIAVGMWPLTAALLLMIGLLYMAGSWSAP